MMLQQQIKNLQEDIKENIQNINNRGCVHFAFFFSRKLKSLKIPYRIQYCSTWDFAMRKAGSCSHVLIYIPKIGYIDGKGTYNKKELEEEFSYFYDFREKLQYVRKRTGWNDEYNKRQNKKLSTLINKHIN